MERKKTRKWWKMDMKKILIPTISSVFLTVAYSNGVVVKANGKQQPLTASDQDVHSIRQISKSIELGFSPFTVLKTGLNHMYADTNVNSEKLQQTSTNTKKIVYLTFDDGPNHASIPILNKLDQYNAKATFFMLEPNMKQYPQAVKEMVNRGHAVGMHGVTHNAKMIYQSALTVLNEMQTGQKTLEEIAGVQSHLIRSPYGSFPHMKPLYKAVVEENELHLWDWTIDSEDWKYPRGQFVGKVINSAEALASTSKPMIILMHEKPTTLAKLDYILRYFQENGYEMRPLTEQMEPFTFHHE